MENFQIILENAKKHLKVADHMTYVTFPVVKDNKLMMIVMENLFLSLSNAMTALLEYELMMRRISPYGKMFDEKFEAFRNDIQHRYNFDKEQLLMIKRIKEIVVEHKRSPIEFSKDDKFVICSNSYEMKTVTIEQMKEFLAKTKIFIEEIDYILNTKEGSE